MEPDEKIQAHLVSVWRESKKFLSIGGKEGMLVLTNKHLMFIHKTESKMNWWKAITQRQVVNFIKSKNTMIHHVGISLTVLSVPSEIKLRSLQTSISTKVIDVKVGTATEGVDYLSFSPYTVTIPLGTLSGASMPVLLTVIVDDQPEDMGNIHLRLEAIATDNPGVYVKLGEIVSHSIFINEFVVTLKKG